MGYVPDGMDATVWYGASDFRFKNNTNYPVKVVTESYDKNGSRFLTVKIYGTNEDGRYAVPERIQYDYIQPTTQYKADSSVPRGTTRVDSVQNAYVGLKAQTYRYIYAEDGTLLEKQDMGVSSYKMRPTTILYNPADGDPSQPASKPETPATDPGTGTDPGAGTSNPGTGTATPPTDPNAGTGGGSGSTTDPGSSAGTDPGGTPPDQSGTETPDSGASSSGGTGSSSSSGAEEPPVSQDVQA